MNKLVKYFFLLIVMLNLFQHLATAQQNETHGEQSRTIDSLQNILKTSKEDTIKVNTLNLLGKELTASADYKKAMDYYNQGKQLAEKLVYKKGIAISYNNIGIIYMNQGNYPEALKNQVASLKIKEEIKDKRAIAGSYNNIGNIYMKQGNYPEALKNHFTSLKIREEIKDKKGIAYCYNAIGVIYMNQGNYSEALKNYFASLKIREEIKDKQNIAVSYNNIGVIYMDQGNYPEALKNYFASLKIYEEFKDKKDISYSFNNIGLIYYYQGNYPEALKNYFSSLKIKEEIKDKYGIASSNVNLGAINIKLRKLDEAKKQLSDALSLSKEMGDKELIKLSYQSWAALDSTQGNWKQAYEHHKLYMLYKDSLNNEENTKKIVQTQMQYEFDKKEGVTKAEQDKKDAIAKQETQKQKVILILVSCFSLLVAVLALFIFRGYQQKQKANFLLADKNKIIEEKSKEITDSINYAKRIQNAMLPPLGDLSTIFPNSFVLFKPKDIVSGDFYFFHSSQQPTTKNQQLFLAAADCTGHGVPGAFMSLIGTEKLKDAVSQSSDTSEILNLLNRGIKTSLRQSENNESTKDGMDIALVSLSFVNSHSSLEKPNDQMTNDQCLLHYAAANRPIWIIRKNQKETSGEPSRTIEEIKATKKAIGGFTDDNQHFDTHQIQLLQGDTFYIFTDGYADQFGGPDRKKLMTKKFKEILLEIQHKTMKEQEQHLNTFIENWKASTEQIDDILVIGVRI
jgi:tetratricopeptide (TPR) repeat protein